MKRFMLIVKEIRNYLFLRRVVNKAASSTDPASLWTQFKLRKNLYGRIYTVVSLREEDMGEEEVVRNWKAMEMMRPINEYLTSLGLTEIIFPSIEKIPDSRSYLIVYSPIFRETTLSWFIWRLFILAFAISVSYILYNFVF